MDMKELIKFDVRGNDLNGRIPDSIDQLLNLQYLVLIGNKFESPLPAEISNLTKLEYLLVSDLNGGGFEFPDFSKMNSLKYLTLRKCLLTGPIPDTIWKLNTLYYLDLSFNRLFGEIPKDVSSRLPEYIFLRGNELNGTIPAWIMNSTRHIDVSENLFTNNVTEIKNSNSSNLNLFSCLKSDEMATHWEQVGYSCSKKEHLLDHLYINCGGESMPINGTNYEGDLTSNGSSTFFMSSSSSWGFSSMGTYLLSRPWIDTYIINNTCIAGVDDGPLYSTARVSPISLKYYGFCLRNDKYTVKLHFAELVSNDYKAPYIKKSGRVFDVDIQGKNVLENYNIEQKAEGVNKAWTEEIKNVIVNNSKLEIHLYWSGKGSSEVPTDHYGPLISAISVYPSIESGMSPPKMAAISLSALLLLIVLIVYFWKMEDKSHEGVVELYPGGFYNFRKLKAAAKNFKDKLGEGGFGTFYEATLGNGTVVAVEKVSATKDIIRAFREKDSTISLMEHPNLVKLIGCIAEKNQLLLVYEDIGRNSLQNALFGSNRSKLDWATRRNICLGIAEGLAFLHECKQKIVHGNIKPTSIFLDEHRNAKISDFGFSRLHDQGKSRLEGTVVYMAPEYAKYDLLTTKADAYNFGVLVLIVVSGMKEKISMSSSGVDTEYLPDVAAREKHREGHFMNLVDRSMSNTVDWEQADTMLELAMLCLDQYPDQRPTMTQVVKVLKEELELKDLKERLKQLTSGRYRPEPYGEISTAEDTTWHTKSATTSRGGVTDTQISASPSTSRSV
ncbi:probable LRR receptor-like serine/threonine-protein kinase At1g53430 isoform X2 [Ipomoea triloba]|uniref:probable LRR receptor-like serine/threonine-protein kinase At1g53430 isoform X2 n=1 Tax=Ipomoea triloba TaxID=35885 RepID=UPI00125CF26B|nr:probable LRR receptor-like serine/threonine-protein kinase At1g53430 isoform X2 [Ipomoea triloba]